MRSTRLRLASIPVLLLALWLGACADQGGPADPLLTAEQAAFARGGEKGSNGKSRKEEKARGPKVRGRKKDGSIAVYRLAVGSKDAVEDGTATAIIDSQGGCLSAAGHFLCVPQGAVEQPTTFRMKQERKVIDLEGNVMVMVDLSAHVLDADGLEVPVGHHPSRFNKPLTLGLTYEWSSNIQGHETAARVLWLLPDGTAQEVLPGDEGWSLVEAAGRKVLVGSLEHFSRYGIGWPD